MKHHVTYVIMLLRNLSSRPYCRIHRKCSIVFLFVRSSAFAVPNVDKRGASSTYHKDPAEIPTSGAVWSTYFDQPLLTISHTSTTFESFIDLDGGHYESHRQNSHVQPGSFYVSHKPEGWGARVGAVVWGTELQAGRSLVPFPMV
jgi:hypothetical protein